MGHEWKIGDWAEANGNRYFVYRVVGSSVFGVMESGTPSWDIACKAKHLPDCTGWDWEPLKPVTRAFTEAAGIEASVGCCTGPLQVDRPAHQWQFGDWAHSPIGIIRFIAYHGDMWFLCADGLVRPLEGRNAIYLPDCTGFDWTPPSPVKQIEPPSGYRLLSRDETVVEGDLCIEVPGMSSHPSWRAAGGKSIGCTAGFRIDSYGIAAFARKAEIVNPIEPPDGYQIIADGVVSDGDMSLQDCGWYPSMCHGKDINEMISTGVAKAYARKIKPKPIKPPKGYRLMKDEETIRHGDMFWQGGAWNQTGIAVSEITVAEALAKYARYMITSYARKIEPVYRPFANAAEFAPHKGKWLMSRIGNNHSFRQLITSFDDDGVWDDNKSISWEDMAKQYKFEDGTPFGVLDTKE